MWRCNRHFTTGNCGPVDLKQKFRGLYGILETLQTAAQALTNVPAARELTGEHLLFQRWKTRNIQFVNSHNFNSAFGAHTYGNYLIKPWCWSDPNRRRMMQKFNVYLANLKFSNPVYLTGPPSQTVGIMSEAAQMTGIIMILFTPDIT